MLTEVLNPHHFQTALNATVPECPIGLAVAAVHTTEKASLRQVKRFFNKIQ
jgi:hypothetical protein